GDRLEDNVAAVDIARQQARVRQVPWPASSVPPLVMAMLAAGAARSAHPAKSGATPVTTFAARSRGTRVGMATSRRLSSAGQKDRPARFAGSVPRPCQISVGIGKPAGAWHPQGTAVRGFCHEHGTTWLPVMGPPGVLCGEFADPADACHSPDGWRLRPAVE